MGKNPPADAGDTGPLVRDDFTRHGVTEPLRHNCYIHTLKLLRPSRLEPVPLQGEVTEMRSPHTSTKSNPPLTTTRESPCTATKTQHSQKKKKDLEKEKRMCGRGRLYRPLGHCKDFGFCSE